MSGEAEPVGLTLEFRGGKHDGLEFNLIDEDGRNHWVSASFPGQKFKQVFVPIDMNHPRFVEP